MEILSYGQKCPYINRVVGSYYCLKCRSNRKHVTKYVKCDRYDTRKGYRKDIKIIKIQLPVLFMKNICEADDNTFMGSVQCKECDYNYKAEYDSSRCLYIHCAYTTNTEKPNIFKAFN